MSRVRLVIAAIVSLAGACALTDAPVYGDAEVEAGDTRGLERAPFTARRVGTLRAKSLREVSGMAASRRVDDLLWVHNDSGAKAIVHAIDQNGAERARVTARGATSKDWEDMAAFEWQGKPMLVVADIGDNDALRSVVWLHMFVEPDLADLSGDALHNVETDLEWSVPFRFPGGAADCESIAVDEEAAEVLLLTKRENPPRLFSVPLAPEGALPGRGKVRDATFLGVVDTIPRPPASDILADPVFGAYGSQPTAMDLSGRELVVLTYRHGYRYERTGDESWADALGRPPQIILLPRMKQPESLAFDRTGSHLFVTSERRNAPLYRVERATKDAAAGAP